MKKIIKLLSLICIFISLASYSYAEFTSYEAEEYIMKIENINEEIERIDLVNFEECEMNDTGFNYTTTYEIVPLFGEESINHLNKHDTENYYVKQIVRYNYLAGKAAQDIEHTVVSGKYTEFEKGKLITYDLCMKQKFNNSQEFYSYCSDAKEEEFICVKTTTYKPYKLTPIKEISLSDIKNNKLTYNHDDHSNLKIGFRIKNKNNEYKTFISLDNSLIMCRYGSKPIIDKEKITIFDYPTVSYKSNSEYSFKTPLKTGNQQFNFIIIISVLLFIIILTFIILNIKLRKKKLNKN